MAKTFFPMVSEAVPFSLNSEYQYKISIGIEYWDGQQNEGWEVLKIQITHNGNVQGRKPPSFPLGTPDFEAVMEKAKALYDKHKKQP